MKQQEVIAAVMDKFALPRRRAVEIVDLVLARLVAGVRTPEGFRSKHFVLKQRKRKEGAKGQDKPDRVRCVMRLRDPANAKERPEKAGRAGRGGEAKK